MAGSPLPPEPALHGAPGQSSQHGRNHQQAAAAAASTSSSSTPTPSALSSRGSSAQPSRQGSSHGPASVSTEPDSSLNNAGGSAGSKGSGSSRARPGSLRTRGNDKSVNTTPKRAQRQRLSNISTLDAFAPQKERKTSTFKVGNVGLGGRIYLRPVLSTPQQPQSDQPNVRVHRPSSSALDEDGDDHEHTFLGASFTSGRGLRTDYTGRDSVWTKLSTHDVRGAPSDIFKRQPRPQRSMSESTADHSIDGRPAALAGTKAFKVIIDRPDSDLSFTRPKPPSAISALDIPLAHHRVASPRFTATGAPILHGSPEAGYANRSPNRSSANFDPHNEYISETSPNVPNRRHSYAALLSNAKNSLDHLAWRELDGETISPQIYDALAAAPNDPSLIRYSHTGEVIAATPARLVVQITAETFLDYELLSDFFLTVRCYLSTHDLQALLLARFEWAVNRHDDNGRIIRVRSFAAIRHWILNYFAYDFAPDRKLRVIFCRKLNAIFKVVQVRGMGASDVKLVADLKKCWNGRCVMYWDRQIDNTLEADILPGGTSPHGQTDSEELDGYGLGSVTAASTDMYSVPTSPSEDYDMQGRRESNESGSRGHGRTASGTTSLSAPLSPISDVSLSVTSCSIPALMAKKVLQTTRQMIGPVPAGQRPQAGRSHTSNGSSEALREAHSLPTSVYRSVLRGHLLPPASPYVTTAPTTPGLSLRPMRLPHQAVADAERKKVVVSGTSAGPGMKNLIGNIKRALSSKTPSTEPYNEIVIMDNAVSPSGSGQRLEGLGRNANVPMEVFSKIDTPNSALGSIRAAMRIDLLAEQISIEFQKATTRQAGTGYNAPVVPEVQSRSDQGPGAVPSFLHPSVNMKKLPSGMTSSSQSILIFDDTGTNASVPRDESSGADQTPRESIQIQVEAIREPHPATDHAAGGNLGHLAPDFIPQRRGSSNAVEISTRELNSAQTSTAGTPIRLSFAGNSHVRNPSQASSLRRVASYQSALNKPIAGAQGSRAVSGANTPLLEGDSGTTTPASTAPGRGLRRVPGGDLRANQNIADLEPIVRPRSTGSIATFSSTRESEMLSFGDRITKTFKRDRTDRPLISPGLAGSFDPALKEEATPKVSFMRSHSEEKATRRPSFEAVVASFAEIPDEDEGGIEATLLKLEGRYMKGALPRNAVKTGLDRRVLELERTKSGGSASTVQQPMAEAGDARAEGETGSQSSSSRARKAVQTMVSTDYAQSEDSYNSTPLLERGADSMPPGGKGKDVVTRIEKPARLPAPAPAPARDAAKSFLLDEGDDDDDSMSDGTFDTMDTRETNTPENGLSQNPRPPSPPISDENAAKRNRVDGLSQSERRPPTPDQSPSTQFAQPQFPAFAAPTSQTHPTAPKGLPLGLQPRHMPFVLGHDSDVMFQQLTLIEKDALREIDWRDLVNLRWQQQAETITNWVTYLSSRDPQGIDLVTSRFNIVVKWALSELVLTESLEERALTIIKYIHIATAARRLGNYATLLQLTIALTSTDCTRLRGTWTLVPQAEQRALAELEALVSPHRNFAALRSEMEDSPAEAGCIPVLALYIHDLTYNSQKPMFIESQTQDAGVLVNFERYRSAAVIVKNLLRLIDASSRYNFVPVDDVLSHCMWMSSLPDDDIYYRSKAIEAAETAAM